jgi:hypothetical protein
MIRDWLNDRTVFPALEKFVQSLYTFRPVLWFLPVTSGTSATHFMFRYHYSWECDKPARLPHCVFTSEIDMWLCCVSTAALKVDWTLWCWNDALENRAVIGALCLCSCEDCCIACSQRCSQTIDALLTKLFQFSLYSVFCSSASRATSLFFTAAQSNQLCTELQSEVNSSHLPDSILCGFCWKYLRYCCCCF